MPHITLLACDNCAISGITGVIDAFDIANKWNFFLNRDKKVNERLFTWDLVTIDGNNAKDPHNFSMTPSFSIDKLEKTDLILIPGFLPPFDFVKNVPEKLITWLKKWHKKGVLLGSVCTGSFLLAETGLLNGKTATTNWYFAKLFNRLYPEVNMKPQRIITEDSGIICAGATTAFLHLVIYIMEKFGYNELASLCSKSLLIDTAKQSQSPYMVFDFQKDHPDETILKAQKIMEENFNSSFSVESLASDLGISVRHFIRRFKKATGDSPLLYLQRIRIEDAKNKLEKTLEPIDSITRMVGYEDTNSFRKLFKKHTGLSPREYRTKFKKTG